MVKIGPVVLQKKKLTHDGRQPIAISHLSDSGDLKICFRSIQFETPLQGDQTGIIV